MEGERRGTPFHQIFCGWNGVPPNIVGVSRNGGAVAFRQMPCPNHVNTTVGAAAAIENTNNFYALQPTGA